MAGRMTKIKLDEISLVDYPAHTVPGFPIIKANSNTDSSAIMDALGKRNSTHMPTDQEILEKGLAELPVADLVKALEARADSEDIVKALVPEAVVETVDSEEDVYKSLPADVRAILKQRDEQLAEAVQKAADAETSAQIEKAARLDREAIEVSKSTYTNLAFDHEKFGPAFRKFAEADADAAEVIETTLKAVNEQADGAIFKELGSTAPTASGDAKTQIETIAKALVADGKATDMPDGIAKATSDPANKALVDAYFKE